MLYLSYWRFEDSLLASPLRSHVAFLWVIAIVLSLMGWSSSVITALLDQWFDLVVYYASYLLVTLKVYVPVHGRSQVHIILAWIHERHFELMTVEVELLMDKLLLLILLEFQMNQYMEDLTFPSSQISYSLWWWDSEIACLPPRTQSLAFYCQHGFSIYLGWFILSRINITFSAVCCTNLGQLTSFCLSRPNKSVTCTHYHIMLQMVSYRLWNDNYGCRQIL